LPRLIPASSLSLPATTRSPIAPLSLGLVLGCLACACRPAPAPGPAPAAGTNGEADELLCGLPVPPRQGLLVAGSGSNLALIREVARLYEQADPARRVEVPASIGTAGAVAAVLDGAISLGLSSRPLSAAEIAAGAVETPYVETAVVWAAAVTAPPAEVPLPGLLALLDGPGGAWPDGTPVVPLLRERGDSSNVVFRARLPGFGEALERALGEGRWRLCVTDQELEAALIDTPGALGLTDLGTLRLGRAHGQAAPLRLQGFPPPTDLSGTGYPFRKRLGFLTRGLPQGEAAAFIQFARSPATAALLAAGGYRLLPPEG